MTLDHKIHLKIGDWSKDGHNDSDDVFIVCNIDMKALESAYKQAVHKIGINPIEDICANYKEGTYEQLADDFKDYPNFVARFEGLANEYEAQELWVSFIMEFVRLVDSSICYTLITDRPLQFWPIGGYGFYE